MCGPARPWLLKLLLTFYLFSVKIKKSFVTRAFFVSFTESVKKVFPRYYYFSGIPIALNPRPSCPALRQTAALHFRYWIFPCVETATVSTEPHLVQCVSNQYFTLSVDIAGCSVF